MTQRYSREMDHLPRSFAWTETADIKPLQKAIRSVGFGPLRVVGSGGSLSAAHALANLHQFYTGHLAGAATPLELAALQWDPATAVWLISAGGNNVDILAAARLVISREPRQLAVLCARQHSALAELCRNHRYVDLLIYPPPVKRDGFLATNSLLGFVALLTRAYATTFDCEHDWRETALYVNTLLQDPYEAGTAWSTVTSQIWKRSTTVVLHGASTRLGAIDLESKFTEAALGHITTADYRNFAHGRHHWLAKRADTSAVLAFTTSEDRDLAEHTLALIPADIPQARIEFSGGPPTTALASLLAALRLTGYAGHHRGIDPGRPGVPDFGRRLYHLRVPSCSRPVSTAGLTSRDAAAIARKSAVSVDELARTGTLAFWQNALREFRVRLCSARFVGVVLDYDGTLVDARHRQRPPDSGIADELVRILETGTPLAIATGRGASVRRDLQACLPPSLWPLVLVGYYNGAEIALLRDDGAPDKSAPLCPILQPIAHALREQSEISACVRQEDRPSQITLEVIRPVSADRIWDLACDVVHLLGAASVSVTRSSHSIDLTPNTVSKSAVVRALQQTVGLGPVLAVGDQGRWPGNDHELLRTPFALSVDAVTGDPATCWHFGAPGQRGPAVTRDYLSWLRSDNEHLAFAEGALR